MSRYAIEVRSITKDYQVGGIVSHVLRDLSVGVAAGEFASIMEPSGSGKSTLLITSFCPCCWMAGALNWV